MATAGGDFLKVLNNSTTRVNQDIRNKCQCPTAMPGIKSEDVETKNTNFKVKYMLDHLASIKNKELVKIHRTILPTTSLPTAKGVEISNAIVHRTQRSTEELEADVKTKGNDKSKNAQ